MQYFGSVVTLLKYTLKCGVFINRSPQTLTDTSERIALDMVKYELRLIIVQAV